MSYPKDIAAKLKGMSRNNDTVRSIADGLRAMKAQLDGLSKGTSQKVDLFAETYVTEMRAKNTALNQPEVTFTQTSFQSLLRRSYREGVEMPISKSVQISGEWAQGFTAFWEALQRGAPALQNPTLTLKNDQVRIAMIQAYKQGYTQRHTYQQDRSAEREM